MKGLPKRFATADDIRNCHALANAGELSKSELLEAMEELEEQNYIHCPIRDISGDAKTITIGYCAEANEGDEAIVGNKTVTLKSVTHIEGEGEEGMDAGYETTELGLSAKAPSDADMVRVKAPYNIYDQLGMEKEEFDEIKADLAKLQ